MDVVEIAKLLKSAYNYWLEKGLKFGVSEQTVEEIACRINSGKCIVALYGDELVGTVSYQRYKKGIYFMLLGVSENNKRQGIATILINYLEKIAKEEKLDFITADTSKDATWLLNWYCGKMGYKKYTLIRQPGRIYKSICFRKYINHVWRNRICGLHHIISCLIVR